MVLPPTRRHWKWDTCSFLGLFNSLLLTSCLLPVFPFKSFSAPPLLSTKAKAADRKGMEGGPAVPLISCLKGLTLSQGAAVQGSASILWGCQFPRRLLCCSCPVSSHLALVTCYFMLNLYINVGPLIGSGLWAPWGPGLCLHNFDSSRPKGAWYTVSSTKGLLSCNGFLAFYWVTLDNPQDYVVKSNLTAFICVHFYFLYYAVPSFGGRDSLLLILFL